MTRKPPTTGKLKKKAWQLLSLIVRKSAADHRGMAQCFTCPTVEKWEYMDAGHGIGGRHNSVLFDEDIIKCQCKICNVWKRGNYPVFTTNLIRLHSVEWMENKLIQSKQNIKWTRGELLERIESYEKRLEELG